jgi:hypothetical protein
MSNIYIQETWVNKTAGYVVGESDVYETWFTDTGKLFKHLQKEYGRCTGKVYVGDNRQVGWGFEKLTKYTDSKDTYLQETWVTVHTAKPVKTISYQYADF